MVCSLIPTPPSLVGHVLVTRNLPLLNLHHHQHCVLWTSEGQQLSQVSHTAETLSCFPWPPNMALDEMLKVKMSKKSSRSLSALGQLNSREQNIPCSVLEFGFLCKILKEHSNEEKVWDSTVNILSTVYIFNITQRYKQYSKFQYMVSRKYLSSLSLWMKLLALIQSCQDWAKWVRTRIFYLLHEEHK